MNMHNFYLIGITNNWKRCPQMSPEIIRPVLKMSLHLEFCGQTEKNFTRNQVNMRRKNI